MKFPSTQLLLISALTGGNLKILRIYASNFIVRSYVRSPRLRHATIHCRFPAVCRAITRERRISVLSNAICATLLTAANWSILEPQGQTELLPKILNQIFLYVINFFCIIHYSNKKYEIFLPLYNIKFFMYIWSNFYVKYNFLLEIRACAIIRHCLSG